MHLPSPFLLNLPFYEHKKMILVAVDLGRKTTKQTNIMQHFIWAPTVGRNSGLQRSLLRNVLHPRLLLFIPTTDDSVDLDVSFYVYTGQYNCLTP